MADSLSMSMGGRVASIYRQNTKRRRFTTVVNDIESKRLGFIKKQLEYDRLIENNKLNRYNEKLINANDEMKAFQTALIRRIASVRDQNKLASGPRPLHNLGKYGGASVEYIKTESEKYKRIRDPQKRRMIKTRILLNQGKRDGRIKEYDPVSAGNLAEDILQLYKTDLPNVPQAINVNDIANLEDVADDEDLANLNASPNNTSERNECTRKLGINEKKLNYHKSANHTLPPLQVARSLNSNSNYYRKISADYRRQAPKLVNSLSRLSPIHKRLATLEDIAEEGNTKRKRKKVPSLSSYPPPHSNERSKCNRSKGYYFEWDYARSVGPVKIGKSVDDGQKFWKPKDSVPKSMQNVILPKIE